jgi:hypothetical protein
VHAVLRRSCHQNKFKRIKVSRHLSVKIFVPLRHVILGISRLQTRHAIQTDSSIEAAAFTPGNEKYGIDSKN